MNTTHTTLKKPVVQNQSQPPDPYIYVHYWKQVLCRVPETVGKDLETVGNGFADGRTRHRTPGKIFLGQGSLPRALGQDPRQRLCREPTAGRRRKKVTVTN
jgi:hypothetical protein